MNIFDCNFKQAKELMITLERLTISRDERAKLGKPVQIYDELISELKLELVNFIQGGNNGTWS